MNSQPEKARHIEIMPPVETCGMAPLWRQVQELERNRNAWKSLATQMWVTLKTSLERGALADYDPTFLSLRSSIDRWEEVLDALAR